jgi:hypothetical protein
MNPTPFIVLNSAKEQVSDWAKGGLIPACRGVQLSLSFKVYDGIFPTAKTDLSLIQGSLNDIVTRANSIATIEPHSTVLSSLNLQLIYRMLDV